jgi:hypothetical protein
MPRRNKHKREPHFHGATIFDKNYKPGCLGCAFAGQDFKCLASDGFGCLKGKPARKEGGDDKAK